MLILTRRPVETIYIGDEVTVTVLGVVGNQVRFGIEAPRHIVIDRAEIHERKRRQKLAEEHGGGEANGNVADDEPIRRSVLPPRNVAEPSAQIQQQPMLATDGQQLVGHHNEHQEPAGYHRGGRLSLRKG